MQRGQIDMMPIYILGSIILLLILAFGYNSISGLREAGTQVSSLKLIEDLKKDIKAMSLDYGSSKQFTYAVSEDVKKVCFFRVACKN